MSKRILETRYFQSSVKTQLKPVTLTLAEGDSLGERHSEVNIFYNNPNQKQNMYPVLLSIPEWHMGSGRKTMYLIEEIFNRIADTFDYPLYTHEQLFTKLNLLDDYCDFDPENYGYTEKSKTSYGELLYGEIDG